MLISLILLFQRKLQDVQDTLFKAESGTAAVYTWLTDGVRKVNSIVKYTFDVQNVSHGHMHFQHV